MEGDYIRFVVVDKMGHGIASFDTMEEAALFQYKEKIFLETEIIPIRDFLFE